jgi:DNA-binding response OmpR family regulator
MLKSKPSGGCCLNVTGIKRFKLKSSMVFDRIKVSGWDVGKAIKRVDPKIPVAMITGWGMEVDREKMSESGIDLIIAKPFNFEQVIQLVSEAIDLKEKM